MWMFSSMLELPQNRCKKVEKRIARHAILGVVISIYLVDHL